MNPLVSIIYPVFNDSPDYITQSLSALLSQDYDNFEIIIVDDSTNLDSKNCIDEFAILNTKINVIRSKNNNGLPQALNIGIEASKGIFIARADADDISVLERLRIQSDFLCRNPEIDIVGSNIVYIDNNGKSLKIRKYPETSKQISKYLHLRNPFAHPTVMIRKEFFGKIGFYDISLKRAEDYDLWFRADSGGINMYNLQQELVYYRVSDTNKRDILNWKINLNRKIKNFSFKYFFSSLFGILSLVLFLVSPTFLKSFIYKRFS